MEDVLYILKNTILSEQLNTVQIKNIQKTRLAELSPQLLKKFMVEFLFELKYSAADNKIEEKMNKNPIVLDIFVLLFRKLLVTLNVNAEDFNKTVPSVEAIRVLVDYFDLNCKYVHNLLLFYEEKLFICMNNEKDVVFGKYSEYFEPKKN